MTRCAHCTNILVSGKAWSCRRCDYRLVCCSHRNKGIDFTQALYDIVLAAWPILRLLC